MADFRKWLLAFAVVALLSGLSVPAFAQSPLLCQANAGVPVLVRAEGLAELVGDVVLDCRGGQATAAGLPVPKINIQIFLSTNVTSRLLGSSTASEALLIFDDAHGNGNPSTPLRPCAAGAFGNIIGVGANPDGVYNTAPNCNVYQGSWAGVNNPNSISWNGVPFDPPGTARFNRTIRITNIRANANQLGVSSTLIPTPITEYISVTPATLLPINNPQQVVATILPGLTASAGTANFVQCTSNNGDIAADNTAALDSVSFAVHFKEGFASSWKVRNIAQLGTNPVTATDVNQDYPGANYGTESGFYAGSGDEPDAAIVPPPTGGTPAPAGDFGGGLAAAGQATQGTRLMATFGAVPSGVTLFVPTAIPLYSGAGLSGYAVLVSTDANGAGASTDGVPLADATSKAYTGSYGSTQLNALYAGLTPVVGPVAFAPVSVTSGGGIAVYEIVQTNVTDVESADIPVGVAYVSNVSANLPTSGLQSTVIGGFAPSSTVGLASQTAPVPRFAPSTTPANTFIVNLCSCNILFPFVTNQQGYDTGVAISNTSLDPFGTAPQTGTVTLYYYGPGTPPASQTTNGPVPAGEQLLFTLSGGGNFGIDARTAGFQGYIIASAHFQYCHAFAYVSAQGATPTQAGASEGYLGIVLDQPLLQRTNNFGEVAAH